MEKKKRAKKHVAFIDHARISAGRPTAVQNDVWTKVALARRATRWPMQYSERKTVTRHKYTHTPYIMLHYGTYVYIIFYTYTYTYVRKYTRTAAARRNTMRWPYSPPAALAVTVADYGSPASADKGITKRTRTLAATATRVHTAGRLSSLA